MPSAFDALLANVDTAVLDVMGEGMTITPMARPSPNAAQASPDPARAEVAATGIFGTDPAELDAGSGNTYDPRADQRLARVSTKLAVTLRRSALGYDPRVGDRVTRTGTGEVFTVADMRRDGSDLWTLTLNAAG